MRKFFKRFFLIFGIFLLLLILAAIILPIIYKNKIIEFAKAEVNKQINAKLDFDNDISLTLFSSFPDFSLGVKNIKVINKAPFEGDTLVAMGKLSTTLDLMSVLKGGKIQIKSFDLDKPFIHLMVNKNGVSNWDIAIKNKDSVAKAGQDTGSNFKMGLQHYAINDGVVIYDDQQGGMYTRLDKLNHSGKGDFTQNVFDLDTKTDIDQLTFRYGGVDYLHKVKTMLKLTLNMDMAKSKYTFKENELDLNDLALGFDGWVAMPTSDIDMDLKFNAKKTDFKNIISLIPAIYMKDYSSLKSSGKFAMEGTAKGIYNDKVYPAFNVLLQINNGMFQYPALPAAVSDVNVDTKVSSPGGPLDAMVINISKAHLNFGGDPFDAHMLVQHPMTDPAIDGAVKGRIVLDRVKDMVKLDPGTSIGGTMDMDITMKGVMSSIENKQYDKFDAHGYAAGQNISYASADLAQPVKISSTRLDFTPQAAKLSNTGITIGKSDMQVAGDLSNYLGYMMKNQTIHGNMTLNSNYMDVNALMGASKAPAVQQNAPAAPQNPGAAGSTQAVDIPANIDFNLKAKLNRIVYDVYDISNMAGQVLVHDKKLELKEVAMDMVGGHFTLDGNYDSNNPNSPKTAMNFSIKQLDIPTTFKTFVTVQKYASIAQYIKGRMDAKVYLSTELGKDMMPVYNSLTSNGDLAIDRAEITNYPPLAALAQKLNMSRFNDIVVTGIHPSYYITNGRFYLKDPIKFNVDQAKCAVVGSSGLDKTLDYTMDIEMPSGDLQKQANTLLQNLTKQNISAPIGQTVKLTAKITGTVDKPQISLALGSMANSIAQNLKDQAKAEFDKQKKALEDKANAEIAKRKAEAQQKLDAEKQKAIDQANALKKQQEDQLRKQADDAKKKAQDEANKQKQNLENQAKDQLKKKLPWGK